MWEDKSAQLCDAAKNLSLDPTSFSPPFCAGVPVLTLGFTHAHIYSTPTPIAGLFLEVSILF